MFTLKFKIKEYIFNKKKNRIYIHTHNKRIRV